MDLEPTVPPAVAGEAVGSLRSQRLRLDLAYDGTEFSGWAKQPGLRTVEGVFEEALSTVVRAPVRVTVAGRTDAGVHSRGQVVHADVPVGLDLEALPRRIRGVLPPDISLLRAAPAAAGFHARWSALWRRYEYRVADGVADPLRRRFVYAHRRPVDIDAMNLAAQRLLGEHNFAGFCRARAGASTIRTMLECQWQRDGDEAVLRIRADAFCHSMVRSVVGAMLAIGDGHWPLDRIDDYLDVQTRPIGITVASPAGLSLEEVAYPPDDQLAAQAIKARRFRGERGGAE